MGDYTSHFIHANGINIHYWRSAPFDKKPSILLMHGMTDNGICWKLVADMLCEEYDLIMPDARGHGLSEKRASGFTIEDRAADAAALIEALLLDRPVVIGASMGGMDATAVAGLYPYLVRGAILEDPSWFPLEPGLEERASNAQQERDKLILEQTISREAIMESWIQEEPGWSAVELGLVADAHYQVSPDSLFQIISSYHATAWRKFLEKARCPILLITADKNGVQQFVTPEMVQEARSLSENVEEVHITNSQHCIHRDQFEPCIRVMKAFLKRVSSPSITSSPPIE